MGHQADGLPALPAKDLYTVSLPLLLFVIEMAAPVPSALPPDQKILVEALSLPPSPSLAAFPVTVLDTEDLARAASPRLDDALRAMPGFGLFRRSSSLAAHPTAQGVSLRSIGPSGAGRTLVLVDGMPANDPFGGWVYWSALSPATIERIDIIRGGGASLYGNAALAGTIRIETRLPQGTGGYADLSTGTKSTFAGSGGAWTSIGAVTLDVGGQIFDSAGYDLIDRRQQGSIDRPGGSDMTRGQLGLTWHGDDLTLRLQAAAFDEHRDNGTPGATNSTRSREMSLRAVQTGDHAFEATLWGIDRKFRSRFTSVTADRSAESPALDQFNTPVKAVGGNLLMRREIKDGTLEFGGDARLIDGETNELFQFQSNAFQRLRTAGGKQGFGGLFADYSHDLGTSTQMTVGLRLDYLRDSKGIRRESQVATSAVLRNQDYASRDRVKLNGRLGLVHDWTASVTTRISLYSGFRNPTINELYRPFRVRNDITEANPALTPEQIHGADLGLDFKTATGAELSITAFWTRLEHAVSAVLLTTTPGNYPEFGVFLPAGGSLSQRSNLDRLRTVGLELDASLPLGETITLTGRYLLSQGEITKARLAPELIGKRPPQSARHQASFGFDWTPLPPLRLAADLRLESAQYDDALNSRRLPGYATADLSASLNIAPGLDLYGTAQNIFNRTIISGESADGLRSLGTPRLIRGGIRAKF